MIMSVRKGKRLMARLLPFLPSSQAAAVVMVIARNLPALAKKDKQEQVMVWDGFNKRAGFISPKRWFEIKLVSETSVTEKRDGGGDFSISDQGCRVCSVSSELP